ncbi:MAG: 50S ribosomal protein L25/general stress protein Ctc [Gammaproteobacteria bacterium]
MVDFQLNAELRSDKGKGASRRLRRANRVPAIIYGMDKEPTPVSFNHDELVRALQHEAFYAHVLKINLGGRSEKAVLRDVQRHPAKPVILHIDLQRVSESEKIRVNVPFHFLGEDVAPGVKQGGGMVFRAMVDAEVECLPKDLPEFIEVDVSNLNLGESIRLSEVKLPEGVAFVEPAHGQDPVVATIHGGRMAAAEDEEAAGEAAPEA